MKQKYFSTLFASMLLVSVVIGSITGELTQFCCESDAAGIWAS